MNAGDILVLILPSGEKVSAQIVAVEFPKKSLRTTVKKGLVSPKDFGSRVRTARKALGMSQQMVAAACKMSVATVNRIENGKYTDRGPNQGSLQNLENYLKLGTMP